MYRTGGERIHKGSVPEIDTKPREENEHHLLEHLNGDGDIPTDQEKGPRKCETGGAAAPAESEPQAARLTHTNAYTIIHDRRCSVRRGIKKDNSPSCPHDDDFFSSQLTRTRPRGQGYPVDSFPP